MDLVNSLISCVDETHRAYASQQQSYFLAYSCVLSRNGIAPYRELTFLAHRDNVKSVDETHRVYASQQRSYFLIEFIYKHML